jgi:hypothetical protein
MSAFGEKQVQAAIDRLPGLSSKDVREQRKRAETKGLEKLKVACDEELARRPFEFSQEHIASFENMAKQVLNMSLVDAIRYAFTHVKPADEDEVRCLQIIAAKPGATYKESSKDFGKGHLSLVLGHLVYERYGCFRKFLQPTEDQSSVLISKDYSGESVRYTLKPEAAAVFRELNILG